jgi:hypothetical protein
VITVDARLPDGRSALHDLQHCGPSGGLVRSKLCSGNYLVPGNLIRREDGWCVIVRLGTVVVEHAGRRVCGSRRGIPDPIGPTGT